MKTPSEYIEIIEKAEKGIYETGFVRNIEYKSGYIIVYFSEKIDGVEEIRMAIGVNRGKSLNIILERINELLDKSSLMKGQEMTKDELYYFLENYSVDEFVNAIILTNKARK